MKKLIIIGSIVLVLLLCIQTYWFTKSYDANATAFDHKVSAALYSAADSMSSKASVQKRSSNYFYVTTNAPVTSKTVDTLIQKALSEKNIDLDYEIGVYNAEDDSLIHVTSVKSTSELPFQDLQIEPDNVQKNFAVIFPTRKNFLFGQTDLWMLLALIAVLLFWSGFHLVKLESTDHSEINNHLIQLGNCSLDFHNQYLTVNGDIYQLTYKENKILQLFFENPNQVIEREIFLEKVWEKDGFFVARSMDVFISKIRKYLKSDETIRIENLRAIGYRLHVNGKKA